MNHPVIIWPRVPVIAAHRAPGLGALPCSGRGDSGPWPSFRRECSALVSGSDAKPGLPGLLNIIPCAFPTVGLGQLIWTNLLPHVGDLWLWVHLLSVTIFSGSLALPLCCHPSGRDELTLSSLLPVSLYFFFFLTHVLSLTKELKLISVYVFYPDLMCCSITLSLSWVESTISVRIVAIIALRWTYSTFVTLFSQL